MRTASAPLPLKKFAVFVFSLVPLFTGLFLIRAKPAPVDLLLYVHRYFGFIGIFLFWAVIRSYVQTLAHHASTRSEKVLRGLTLFILVVFWQSFLFYFKKITQPEYFYIVVALIALSALYSRFLYTKKIWPAAACGIFFFAGLGFLSFQMVIFAWEWQPFLFSAAIGSMVAALSILASDERDLVNVKAFNILSLLGPLFIGALVISNQLSRWYFAVFLFVPIIVHLGTKDETDHPGNGIFWKGSAVFVLFMTLLGVLGVG